MYVCVNEKYGSDMYVIDNDKIEHKMTAKEGTAQAVIEEAETTIWMQQTKAVYTHTSVLWMWFVHVFVLST